VTILSVQTELRTLIRSSHS